MSLAAAFALVVVLRIGIHQQGISKNIRLSYTKTENSKWFEYDNNTTQQSTLLTQTSKLDFLQIEKILWRSKRTDSGLLEINATTLELLEQIHALLPESIEKKEADRLSFLVKRSVPGAHGEKLAHLIRRYSLYTQNLSKAHQAFRTTDAKQRVSLIMQRGQERENQQTHFFGPDIAIKLFRKKNITNEYLDQRTIVNLDANINSNEKKRRLRKLEDMYKLSLSKNL